MRLVTIVIFAMTASVQLTWTHGAEKTTEQLQRSLDEAQTERDGLAERVAELEKQDVISRKKIEYLESDLRICEADGKEYDRKLRLGLKEYTEIYREKQEMEKSLKSCNEDKDNLQVEQEDSKRIIHKLKVSVGENLNAFSAKIKAFQDDNRDDSWNSMARLYGECWIAQKGSELRGEIPGQNEDADKPDENNGKLQECQTLAGTVKQALEECYAKLNTWNAEERKLRAEILEYKKTAESCDQKVTESTGEDISACSCRGLEEELQESKDKFVHKIDQFHTCKLQKQSHKVITWFMSKELVSLKHKILKVKEDMEVLQLQSASESKFLTKTKKDNDRLRKDYHEAEKNYDQAGRELDKATADLKSCKSDKDQIDFVRKGSQMLINQLEDKESKLKREVESLEKETDAAIEGAERFRMKFTMCLIIIFAFAVTKLYFYAKAIFDEWREREREEKVTLKKERRERKKQK